MNVDGARLLVVAPHADDESIGSGGLIARAIRTGGSCRVFTMRIEHDRRRDELGDAAHQLGFQSWISQRSRTPVDERDSFEMVAEIEQVIGVDEPDIVVMPHYGHAHQEHRATANAVLAACRPNSGSDRFRPPVVLVAEQPNDVWSLGERPRIQWSIELTPEDLQAKIDAVLCHSSQVRPAPSERSIDAIRSLAALRGSQVGSPLAEAYEVVRWHQAA